MTDIRNHSSDDMTGPEFNSITEPVAVVLRPDGSIDVYGSVAVIDQRPKIVVDRQNENDKHFIAVKGIPRTFGELWSAENYAADQTEQDHEDRTIFVIPRNALDYALVARYKGVELHTIQEVRREDEDKS